jgi:hypothetical protein
MEKTHILTMLYRSHLTIFSIDNQHEKGSKQNAMEWSTTAYFPPYNKIIFNVLFIKNGIKKGNVETFPVCLTSMRPLYLGNLLTQFKPPFK